MKKHIEYSSQPSRIVRTRRPRRPFWTDDPVADAERYDAYQEACDEYDEDYEDEYMDKNFERMIEEFLSER